MVGNVSTCWPTLLVLRPIDYLITWASDKLNRYLLVTFCLFLIYTCHPSRGRRIAPFAGLCSKHKPILSEKKKMTMACEVGRSQFSFSTVSGVQLRFSGLAARVFHYWAISLPTLTPCLFVFFICPSFFTIRINIWITKFWLNLISFLFFSRWVIVMLPTAISPLQPHKKLDFRHGHVPRLKSYTFECQ